MAIRFWDAWTDLDQMTTINKHDHVVSDPTLDMADDEHQNVFTIFLTQSYIDYASAIEKLDACENLLASLPMFDIRYALQQMEKDQMLANIHSLCMMYEGKCVLKIDACGMDSTLAKKRVMHVDMIPSLFLPKCISSSFIGKKTLHYIPMGLLSFTLGATMTVGVTIITRKLWSMFVARKSSPPS